MLLYIPSFTTVNHSQAGIYVFKVNIPENIFLEKLYLKKTPERRSGIFNVNFEQISHKE